MKSVIGAVIIVIFSSSCMVTTECHTYDGSKRHVPSVASTRKAKPVKDRTPFFKKIKLAEKD